MYSMSIPYYKFNTKEEQCNVLYKLIRAIEKFEIGEGYTPEIGYIYESLSRHSDMLDKNGNKISTLSDFIELLYTVEPINWFSKTINKRGKVNYIWKDDLISEYIFQFQQIFFLKRKVDF